MIVAKIQVSGVRANTVYKNFIPAGIIGAQVEISYADDIWQGLRKTETYTCGLSISGTGSAASARVSKIRLE